MSSGELQEIACAMHVPTRWASEAIRPRPSESIRGHPTEAIRTSYARASEGNRASYARESEGSRARFFDFFISDLLGSPSDGLKTELSCEEWGFFYVTNHGIPQNLFTKIREFSDDVFCLRSDTKLKLGPSLCLKTYSPRFIASPYFESFRVSGPDFFASSMAIFDELSGQGRPGFR
ncbi:Detected protein of unknown function [Hibiscus syriacus]|uniref:Non-haem dioxygenase N-terminal domain-containing protein n=1 Tax=Hibiscus syriacus TaxID=106335 RepID=A0A6A3CIS8_HIBSY|nr:Detected protein of unknown function [Hibiscus syriacus]